MHALSDLRMARAYLDQIAWPPVQKDEEHAIREIDAAIGEIKRASIDDGKNLEDHPPIDAHMRPDGRFRKALELLDKAHNDTARAEDVPQARGMRDRAVMHIDQAHGTVDDAIRRSIGKNGAGCNGFTPQPVLRVSLRRESENKQRSFPWLLLENSL